MIKLILIALAVIAVIFIVLYLRGWFDPIPAMTEKEIDEFIEASLHGSDVFDPDNWE